jgi:hypothetical protein
MNVHNKVSPFSPAAISSNSPRPKKITAEQSGNAEQEQTIQPSPLSAQLGPIDTGLANAPVVNKARIEEIKLALSEEGRYPRASVIIAERLLERAKELFMGRRRH